MSVNYGGSRTSQMLSQLVLQFSVLYFCSSKRGEKKPKTKRKKKKENRLFSRQANIWPSTASGLQEAVMCSKKLISGSVSLYILCNLCIGSVFIGKKSGLPVPCYHNLKYSSGIRMFRIPVFAGYPPSWYLSLSCI
jgi:hypothetical protein